MTITNINHPICIYFADKNISFKPEIYFKKADEVYWLVTSNPIATAHFFYIMCENFIKHMLGVGVNHPGYFGETEAYYGTIEQQGRLTLHLHSNGHYQQVTFSGNSLASSGRVRNTLLASHTKLFQ